MMQKLKGLLILICIVTGIVLTAWFVSSSKFLGLFVDFLWFKSLNYSGYFFQRMAYRYLTFSGVSVFFFLIFFLNFWVASRFLGKSFSDSVSPKGSKRLVNFLKIVQSGSIKIYGPLSLVLAIPIAIPFYEQWGKGLLFLFGAKAGVQDPAFGKDISYYLFSLPFYHLIQSELFVAFFLLFLVVFLLYFIEKRLLARKKQEIPKGASLHLFFLFVAAAAFLAWGFFLKKYSLVYTTAHQPMFFGPGFVDMWVRLPLIWMNLVFFILFAICLIVYLTRKKGLKSLAVSAILLLLALWGSNGKDLSNILEKYWVKPDESIKEKPYINYNIQATLDAFNLRNVKIRKYKIKEGGSILDDSDVRNSLRNIPIWDRDLLDGVYKQLQGIRPYYVFPGVDVDRYTVSGRYQQVYLAPRELDLGSLPDYTRSWMNKHLQYTHGYGLVMTPAAQGGDEPMTWFVKDIPCNSDYGLAIKKPRIYFGFGKYDYALVPNEMGEIDAPGDQGNKLFSYNGIGGVPVGSFFRKLIFAAYFKERNIFFTSKTKPGSRIMFIRNVKDRIKKIAPFFRLDKDPYLVSTPMGQFWIQDGYTTSAFYPNVRSRGEGFNYIRNSVKIVVDAYNGNVDFYVSDPNDPIIRSYAVIYPGLLKKMKDMPKEIKKHLRYPKDLFRVQMDVYARYHQTDPAVFYRQEDNWDISKFLSGQHSFPMKPYYLTLNLLNPEKHEFLLLSSMSPMGRNNLRALAIAGCDGENYGRIIIYSFPKGQQVYGPSQVEALIDQDTDIAQQLTLWDQAGSEVIRGRMIILPVGNMIFYIQPVYLSSAKRLKIPELKRIIVSQGDIVAMAPTFEESFGLLETKIKQRRSRHNKRFPLDQIQPGTVSGHKVDEVKKPAAGAPGKDAKDKIEESKEKINNG